MFIEIYYCGVWNYLPQASRLEEELKGNFPNIRIKIIKSSGGTFQVFANKKVIYDKLALSKQNARFPMDEEISNILRDKFGYA